MARNGSKKKKGNKLWYNGLHSKPVISVVETQSFKHPNVTEHKLSGFYSATRWMMLGARMVGLLSLSGLRKNHSRNLRFTLRSPYTFLYCLSLAGQIFMSIMSANWLLCNKFSLAHANNCLFFTLSALLHLIIGNIGRTWPKLVAKVEQIEKNLPPFKRNIPLICNITSVLLPLSTLIIHVLRIWYRVTIAISCKHTDIAHYFYTDKPWIFKYVTVAWWKGILTQIIPIQSLCIVSGNDVLISVVSIYLAEHFQTHYQLLKKASKESQFSCDEFQNQYSEIARLVKIINKQFGICTLLSFGSNMFWICMDLFYILRKNQSEKYTLCNPKDLNSQRLIPGIETTLYLVFSFMDNFVQLSMVLMVATRVHSKSIAPLSLIYQIPTNKFNIQVDRYIGVIKNIKVAASGLDLFYVTRGMTLAILNAIITYELVLLQYNR